MYHCFRLEAYRRNDDFGRKQDVAPEYKMITPDEALYKDVNGDSPLPFISEALVKNYLEGFAVRITSKAQELYENRYLYFVKWAGQDGMFYIHALCYAEMKRNATYPVDISFDTDGVITECQCECGAGMGPEAHCKHVQTVLWALIRFSTSKEILAVQTCTEKLQTFHKARKHVGSPVKCQNSDVGVKEQVFEYEPRPSAFVNDAGYNDMVRNLCINFQFPHSIPLQQTYEPANTYSHALDHDYFVVSPEDQFLADSKVTQISEAERKALETATQAQSSCTAWKQERCKRLHSSHFGTICKAKETTDLDKLAYRLTRVTTFHSAPTRYGQKFEHVAVRKFEERHNVSTKPCGIHVHPERAYLAASPDRVIDDDTLVEVKCPYTTRHNLISPQTVPYLCYDGDELKLSPNHNYYYQVQGQLLCSRRKTCYFVVFTQKDLKVIAVDRDNEFIETMLEKLDAFFEHHFRKAYLRRFFHKDYYSYNFQKLRALPEHVAAIEGCH